MRYQKTVSRSFLLAGIIGGMLIGASPSIAQTQSPFSGSQISVTSSGDASGSSVLVASDTYDAILTAEERELIALKLLPTYYPYLKAAMQGTFGSLEKAKSRARDMFKYPNAVYSTHFGEPPHMLAWAKRYRNDAAMVKLNAATQRGDILLSGPQNDEAKKKDMICVLTGGNFHHAVVVLDGPPCVIVEAVGLTGSSDDPSNNHVRISSWHEQLGGWAGMRLLRPTAGLPADKASKYIDDAVGYAVSQLGKPYDYSFTNTDSTRAYYCSELAYKCYHEGANMEEFKIDKSSSRDRMIIALNAVVDGLKPKDRILLANKIVNFTVSFIAKQPPDIKAFNNFIVDELAPNCDVFNDAFPTPEAREKLRSVLEKVRTNDAFPTYIAARNSYLAAEKSGKFNAGWGIGAARKLAAETRIAGSIVSDINGLVKQSGAGYAKVTKLIGSIIAPLYTNMGTYADFLTGMNKDGSVAIPEGAKTILSMTNWLADKRESVKKWPIGSGLANLLPGDGDDKIEQNFTSPSDLVGTSPNFHIDYP